MKYSFSAAERYAVFTIHGEQCYMCYHPLNLKTMEVDHIIPESLLDKPERLAEVLKELGRPGDFDLNSFANWMPACRGCNGKKRNAVFEPSPIIQLVLQCAAEKAPEAEGLAQSTVSNKKIANALNVLEQVSETGQFEEWVRDALRPLVGFIAEHRAPEMVAEPIRLAPNYTVALEIRANAPKLA